MKSSTAATNDRSRGLLAGPELEGTDEIENQIREHVGTHIGKLARPKRVLCADDLPKTRSGKIMRRLLRDIADDRALGDVTTLRDPAVMVDLEAKVTAERQKEQ
jgi:acetyl-CoA synthetase